MIPKIIEIGPISLHLYGLLIALGIICGWNVAKQRAQIYKINKKIFDSWILLIPLTTSVIGARLYHVLDYWTIYSRDPVLSLKIQNGGLGIWGALFGAYFGFLLISRIEKIKFFNILDLTAPSMVLGQAIGRIGNWINQEGFGPPTTLPWKIFIEPQSRPLQYLNYPYFHPTFFYEAILNLAIFTSLIFLSKKFKKPGQIFAMYLIFYGSIRFFLEFYRLDTWQLGQIKVAQALSIAAISTGILILKKATKNRPK